MMLSGDIIYTITKAPGLTEVLSENLYLGVATFIGSLASVVALVIVLCKGKKVAWLGLIGLAAVLIGGFFLVARPTSVSITRKEAYEINAHGFGIAKDDLIQTHYIDF